MADDDLSLRATLDDDVSSVLARIQAEVEATEHSLDDLDASGRRAGEGVEGGAVRGEKALGKQKTQTEKTKKATEELGDAAEESGEKAKKAAGGWDVLEKKLKRSSRSFGGFRKLLMLFKVAAIVSLVFALAGAVAALGAAAVGAVGGLGAMLPGLLALGPIALAAAFGIKAFSMAAEELEPHTKAFKEHFSGVGEAIHSGGLGAGIDYLTSKIHRFVGEVEQGMGLVGGSMGRASAALGDFLDDDYRLAQTSQLFQGMAAIIDVLAPGVIAFGGGLMNVLVASLPAGLKLAGVFAGIGDSFERWSRAQLESGRATEYINHSLDLLLRAGGVLMDFLVGLFRIFRIGAQESRGLGLGIEDAARRFKEWTGSAQGQQAIRDYFVAAMPAIRETFLLLGAILKMFGQLAASPNIAPLLAQIRTEFLPALGELLAKLSGQDGLGPSLITAATALAKFLTAIDISALVLLLDAIAGLLTGLAWIATNVPGAGFALSTLLTVVLLLGPAFKIASFFASTMGRFALMGKWFTTAAAGAGKLSVAQRIFQGIWGAGMRLAGLLQGVLVARVLPALAMAFRVAWLAATGPVGLIVLAIIAVIAAIVLLWKHCEWFRNAVTATWEWIKNAAIATWGWIKNAAMVTWNAIVGFAQGAAQVIAAIATWLWQNILKPVWDAIVADAQAAWNVITFIVQVVVYIIVGLIVGLAYLLQGIWWLISTAATWAWNTVILPVIQFVAAVAIIVWTLVAAFFGWLWGIIAAGAQFAWGIILFIFALAAGFAMMVWTPVAAFFGWLWGIIVAGAQFAWGIISFILAIGASAAMAVWAPVAGFFGWLFGVIRNAGESAWNGISRAASAVAGAVRGAWNAVTGAVRGAWNGLARGWNSIPSITVPAWVPGIGGNTFSLPKLPTLWHGGTIEYGAAIVGEHGPEPLVVGGRLAGMLGAHGPEVATGLPPGGYVVPALNTLAGMPGLLSTLPSGVAAAVSRSVPGYGDLIRPAAPAVPPPRAGGDDRQGRELVGAVRGLARVVAERPPPISADGRDTEALVLRALRRHDRERELRDRYTY